MLTFPVLLLSITAVLVESDNTQDVVGPCTGNGGDGDSCSLDFSVLTGEPHCSRQNLWATPLFQYRFPNPERLHGINVALVRAVQNAWRDFKGGSSGAVATELRSQKAYGSGEDPNDDFFFWQRSQFNTWHANASSPAVDDAFKALYLSSAYTSLRRFFATRIVRTFRSIRVHPLRAMMSLGDWGVAPELPNPLPSAAEMVDRIAKDTFVWASVQYRGLAHAPHTHPGSALSGVYYVSAPSGSGDIYFEDPRGPYPPFEQTTVNVSPEPGLLLTFPSFLRHAVRPSRNAPEDPRIALAFNLKGDWAFYAKPTLPDDRDCVS